MQRALEKRALGQTGEEVTFLGFGALEIGRDWGLGSEEERQRPSDEGSEKILNTVLDLGINLIDTASAYHQSENRIGKYLKNRRKEYFLATKCGEHNREPETYYDFSYKAVKESIDRSLKLLNTDCIDLMQIHFGPDAEKALADGEVIQAMLEAKAEGKIRFLGASAWSKLAVQCIETGHFDVMQLAYNLLDPKDEHVITLCGEKNIGVLIRTGLAFGKLTPKGVQNLDSMGKNQADKIRALLELVDNDPKRLTSLALDFLYRNKDISSILMGTKNIDHMRENIDCLDHTFDNTIMQKALDITQS